ncbi:MAG: tetratricopeptide repeat protein, partial [Bryobacteraceae bacterium]
MAAALEIASTQEMEATALNALIDLAHVALVQQEIAEAGRLLQQALKVARQQKNRRGEARALSSLASVALQRNDGLEAIRYAEQALRFYRSGSYQVEAENLLNVIAAGRELNGDRQGALALRLEQLRVAKAAGGARAAMAQLRVGNSLRNLERYPESLEYYKEAMKTSNGNDRAFVRKAAAESLWRLGRFQEARNELKAAGNEKDASVWIRTRAEITRVMAEISSGRPD